MLDKARVQMRAGRRRILLRLATGGGKTVMAATMLGGAAERGLRSQFIVHRRELIEQTSETFRSAGIRHGFIASGMPQAMHELVHLAGVQTLVNRLEHVPAPKLKVVDECHHCTAASWDRVIRHDPEAFVIGLTATPERLDGRGLKEHFDVMVDGPSTGELIRMGYLSPFTYYAPGKPDLVGVPVRGGDYNRSELADSMDKPTLVGSVVEHYLKLAPGQRGIVFAVSREHSRHLADEFKAHGVRAGHVDGAMDDRDRKRLVDAFRGGELDIMTNVDLFGEGFDVPGIVYCGLARPTKSLALHLQQCGRALRMIAGKERAIIADHAGNALSGLGLPDDVREWTLEGREKGKRSAGPSDAFGIRQCLECYRVVRSGTEICPGCDTPFPSKGRDVKAVDGELFELERVAAKKADQQRRKDEERQAKTLAELLELGKRRGYDNPLGWAKKRLELRRSWGGKRRWG